MKILACPWLVSLHCIGIYQLTRTHRTGGLLGITSFLLCPLTPAAEERRVQAGGQAHRPLEAKLLLNEKFISEFLYFPQAPKGTTTAVLLSSVPYCSACRSREKENGKELESLDFGADRQHPFSRKLTCSTQITNAII